ncbi:unnamed protein product [Caenorhabditis bovis]|uniref:G-protein coupled receptors family 1 profile domain-containing protein n=1 Tax=Caenorhabditis bovis TaxID=2654633 RepID=A0A8S1E4A8_9PELO|nr:unnamed protein product [Caenorhabditis bovis]
MNSSVSNSTSRTNNVDLQSIFAVANCFVIILGVFGNSLSILVYFRRQMRKNIVGFLLLSLSFIDLLMFLVAMPAFCLFSLPIWARKYESGSLHLRLYGLIGLKFAYPLSGILKMCSQYIIVLISIERWFAVCRPLQVQIVCTLTNTKKAMVYIVGVAIVFNVSRFFEFSVNVTTGKITPLLNEADKNRWYFWIYYCIRSIVFDTIIPFMVILVTNTQVIRQLRISRRERKLMTSQQQKERKTTTMLLVMVILFAVCHMFITGTKSTYIIFGNRAQMKYPIIKFLHHFSNLLLLTYSASTVLIYLMFSQKYRMIVTAIVSCTEIPDLASTGSRQNSQQLTKWRRGRAALKMRFAYSQNGIAAFKAVEINTNAQQLRPAIRVRLNRQIFDQASLIVKGLIEYEVPRIVIPSTRQCFTEGCVNADSFRMASFRQPSFVAFEPHFPNRFRIRVNDFDFMVTGQLSGTIQVILPIPITGTIVVTGRNIGVSAVMDMQKTVNDLPYFRFLECRIDGGFVLAQLANMGLITDSINQKFGNMLSSQSRMQLEEAICEHMNRLTQQHFSTRLARIPRSFSAKELMEIVISNHIKKSSSTPARSFTAMVRRRHTRAATDDNDYYDDIEKAEGPIKPNKVVPAANFRRIQLSKEDVNNFFNIDRLGHILIDMRLLDAAASTNDFSLGISGNVYSLRSQGSSPYIAPYPFRLPQYSGNPRKMVDVVVSQYTLNSLLFHAHRTNSLLFHVDSKTPGIGSLLKTSCTLDEVCISDEVGKIKRIYPNRRLELIVRSSQPPVVSLSQDTATVNMGGRCIFFIEGTRQKIGVIPFTTIVVVNMKTIRNKLQGTITLRTLEFTRDVNFLGLSVSDLDGLRRTTKTALQNFVNSATAQGFDLNVDSIRSPLRLFNPQISFVPNSVLLQADVDLFKTLYHK